MGIRFIFPFVCKYQTNNIFVNLLEINKLKKKNNMPDAWVRLEPSLTHKTIYCVAEHTENTWIVLNRKKKERNTYSGVRQ